MGDYDGAEALLSEVEEKELEAFYQMKAFAENRLLNAAATRADRGEISLTRLDYLAAAEHFKSASDMVPVSCYEKRIEYLNRCA